MGLHENGEYDTNIPPAFSHNTLGNLRYEKRASECKRNQRNLMAYAVRREGIFLEEGMRCPEENLYGNAQGLKVAS
ncbi:MAG: hypothetical protein H0W49_15330 [Nitrospirales bacterium]|nr:hypothetical protein [Nitrospirales bacterium]